MATSRKPLFDPDEKTATEGTAAEPEHTAPLGLALEAPPEAAREEKSREEKAREEKSREEKAREEKSREGKAAEAKPPEDEASDDEPGDEAPAENVEPPLTAPPEADIVASRALMVAALLERSRLESSRDAARFNALKNWVDELGLFSNLAAEGVELFEGKLGSWTDEDVQTVDWTSEELQLLLWAIQKAEFPPLRVRADSKALIGKLPLLGDADAFIDAAKLRSIDELEVQRALCEALLEAIRSEVYARSLQEDPSSFEPDEDLEELLESVADEGFDRKAAAEKGPANEAIQGLRFWSRSLLNELFASGSPHEAHKIDSAELVSLDEETLATWLGVAHSRTEAMAWLLEGDEYETEYAPDEE